MFTSDDTAQDEATAVAEASKQSRKELLKRSLILTAHHPLLGVGPGMFAIAENDYAFVVLGHRGMWHETHNMYTQVSSEDGIPAAILFIAVIVTIFKLTGDTKRVAALKPELLGSSAWLAQCLRVSLMAIAIGGFFLAIAYNHLMPFVAGMVVSLERVTRSQFEKLQPKVS